jgi:hypothetical protein
VSKKHKKKPDTPGQIKTPKKRHPAMPDEDEEEDEDEEIEDIVVDHKHNYVGGAFAYKNSKTKDFTTKNMRETVMMIGYGKARKVSLTMPDQDDRAGVFPQHNSVDEYRDNLELLPSRNLKPFYTMANEKLLIKNKFHKTEVVLTKEKLAKIQKQMSHLSAFAFNQMMNIPRPDKRDFDVYYKIFPKSKQVVTVYTHTVSKVSQFAQVILFNKFNQIVAIRHCSFDDNCPYVLNETKIDKFDNIRQIAHLGAKGGGYAHNSVERFDDGTVTWIVTKDKETGAAALKTDGEIVFLSGVINDAAKLAAQNLGADRIENDEWVGEFCALGCMAATHPMQVEYKQKMREQISLIIDGATIPGLDPIFRIDPKFT